MTFHSPYNSLKRDQRLNDGHDITVPFRTKYDIQKKLAIIIYSQISLFPWFSSKAFQKSYFFISNQNGTRCVYNIKLQLTLFQSFPETKNLEAVIILDILSMDDPPAIFERKPSYDNDCNVSSKYSASADPTYIAFSVISSAILSSDNHFDTFNNDAKECAILFFSFSFSRFSTSSEPQLHFIRCKDTLINLRTYPITNLFSFSTNDYRQVKTPILHPSLLFR